MRQLEQYEVEMYSRLSHFERMEKLRLAVSNLQNWKKGHTERIAFEKDVIEAAQIMLLPYVTNVQAENPEVDCC